MAGYLPQLICGIEVATLGREQLFADAIHDVQFLHAGSRKLVQLAGRSGR